MTNLNKNVSITPLWSHNSVKMITSGEKKNNNHYEPQSTHRTWPKARSTFVAFSHISCPGNQCLNQ